MLIYKKILMQRGAIVTGITGPLDNERVESVAVSGGRIFTNGLSFSPQYSDDNGAIWLGGTVAVSPNSFDIAIDPDNFNRMVYIGEFVGQHLYSANAGVSWSAMTSPNPGWTTILAQFYNGDIYVTTDGSTLSTRQWRKSVNNGVSWSDVTPPNPTASVTTFHIDQTGKSVVVDESNNTWVADSPTGPWTFVFNITGVVDGKASAFRNGNFIFVPVNDGYYHSDDSGVSWSKKTLATGSTGVSIAASHLSTIVYVGSERSIYKTDYSASTNIVIGTTDSAIRDGYFDGTTGIFGCINSAFSCYLVQ